MSQVYNPFADNTLALFPRPIAYSIILPILGITFIISLGNCVHAYRLFFGYKRQWKESEKQKQLLDKQSTSTDIACTSETVSLNDNEFNSVKRDVDENSLGPPGLASTADPSISIFVPHKVYADPFPSSGLFNCYKLLSIATTLWIIGCMGDVLSIAPTPWRESLIFHAFTRVMSLGGQSIGILIYILMLLLRFRIVHYIRPYPHWIDKVLFYYFAAFALLFILICVQMFSCFLKAIQSEGYCVTVIEMRDISSAIGLGCFILLENIVGMHNAYMEFIVGILLLILVFKYQKRIRETISMNAKEETEYRNTFESMKKKLIFFSIFSILVSWLSVISFAFKFFFAEYFEQDDVSRDNLDILAAVLSPLFNTLQFTLSFIYIHNLELINRNTRSFPIIKTFDSNLPNM